MSILMCQVNNTSLYFEKSGKGKPLILLHGNGETHEIFDKAIPLLAEYYTVYAIDSRGHGQSLPIKEFHYWDFAEDIKCFIQRQNLDSPMLYGFSDGGIVGLLVACKYPDLLSQLIISGANTTPKGIRAGWLLLFKVIGAITKEPRMNMMLHEPNITTSMLKKIKTTTTILAGSHDMVKKSNTQHIARHIKHSTLHILKGEGHGSYILHSNKIAVLIRLIDRKNCPI